MYLPIRKDIFIILRKIFILLVFRLLQSLGNHELDLGVEGLLPFLDQVEFPVLVANFNVSSNHAVWRTKSLKKSVVFDIQGHKVGVIGYLTPETKDVTIPNNLEFMPEVVAIK